MPGMLIKLIGANKLLNVLHSKDTIQGPMRAGIRAMTLRYEGLVKKATVVDTGRLRSSVTNKITARSGIVGTNVQYASFVEYGTQKSKPPGKGRHMESGRKVFGLGMFGHALEVFLKKISGQEEDIARGIEEKFE